MAESTEAPRDDHNRLVLVSTFNSVFIYLTPIPIIHCNNCLINTQ